jgi:hypothetical protein
VQDSLQGGSSCPIYHPAILEFNSILPVLLTVPTAMTTLARVANIFSDLMSVESLITFHHILEIKHTGYSKRDGFYNLRYANESIGLLKMG